MVDRQRARKVTKSLPGCALVAASLAGLCSTEAAALSPGSPAIANHGPILIQDAGKAPPGPGQGDARAPFAELNEALAAARARLEDLSKAATAAAAAGQARQELEGVRQENQRLHAELAALRADRDAARERADSSAARLAELSKAAEDAVAEAKRIEDELVTMRWQNAQLNTSLSRAEAARGQLEEEARKAQAELATKVQSLSASAERSATEIARLRGDLAGAEQRLATATSARAAAEARLGELQEAAQSAEARSSRLDEQMAAARQQLDELTAERDRAQRQVAGLQGQADDLRNKLASANAAVERAAVERGDLEQEVGMLRAAAGSAADAARQNLLAVEDRIRELNEALAGVVPAAAAPARIASPGAALAGERVEAPIAPAAAPPPVAARRVEPIPAAATREPTRSGALDADLDLIKSANAAEAPAERALASLTPDLSPEMRLQVQGLLVDLGARQEARGVRLTVPGSALFELDSDIIEPTAHETLAKVAELIDAYEGHEVMIVGHTDSLGDETYNQMLSERRASLVKQFFVDNFEVDGERLAIDGQGEVQPIAPNDTLAGRRANRRIDVLILD